MFLNLQTIKSCCIRGTRDLLNAMEERREQARKVKHKGKRFRFNLRSYTKCRPLCLTAQRSQFTYTIYSYLLFSVFVNCMSAHFNPDHPINSLLQALPLSYCRFLIWWNFHLHCSLCLLIQYRCLQNSKLYFLMCLLFL